MKHQIYKQKPQSPYQSDKRFLIFNPHEVLEPKSPVSQVDLSYSLLILSFDYCSNISPGSSSMVALIRPMCFSAFVDCSLFLVILSSEEAHFYRNQYLPENSVLWTSYLFGQLQCVFDLLVLW